MANELNSIMAAGIAAPTASVYSEGWTLEGTSILTEVSPKLYTGDYDLTTLADGTYHVVFLDGVEMKASGSITVVGGVEVGAPDDLLNEINTRSKFIASEVRD